MTFVELSHPITDGMVTYPGLPGPAIREHTSRAASTAHLADGVSFAIHGIDMVANTGTYLDTPYHYHQDGADLAALPPERLVDVPIAVVRAVDAPSVGAALLGDPGRLWGHAVLVETGWSRRWGTPGYLTGSPYLTGDAARALIDANVALVGIDALNIDDVTDPARPVHNGLLGAGIPIVEHLTNLAALPDDGARLTAVPPPVRGMATFPIRALARL
ncbi:cyclase [Actinocatenispora thailandica]|uniref:Cyclase n=1 Tax=Actinocatenispora thailandica TaxID=227318 RepID=A0A7R7I005_9ACTN|nr:cyclase family protein [Actinocatenispora thailandica]BCJ38902.1 cyclase [Actinocatenispora thailandica]